MNPRGVLCFLIGGLAIGCQRKETSPGGTLITVPSTASSTQSAPERELSVVWLTLDGGQQRSFLLDWQAGKLVVRGERSGSWFAFGNGVYSFEKTSARRSSSDCSTFGQSQEETVEGAAPPPKSLDLEVNGAVAKRLDREGNVEIVEPPELENAESYSNGVSLTASAGRYLFVETWSDELYCGAAHGFRTRGIQTFDLERREFRDLLDREELAELRRNQIQRHRHALVACVTPYAKQISPQIEPQDMLEDLNIAAFIPRYDPKNGFHLEIGWSLNVAYAAATEAWGSYTSGCTETRTRVTDTLALEPPPRALAELMKLHPNASAGGWSRFATSDNALRTTVSAFHNSPEGS